MYSNENKLLGVIGALIGAALGIAVWCFFGSLGYISAIGGLAIVAGAFFGYLLLAKDMSKFGAIFVIALVIVSVYVGVRMTYAIYLKKFIEESGNSISLMDSFKHIEDIIELAGVKSDYIGEIVLSYLFTAIGAFGIFGKMLKK